MLAVKRAGFTLAVLAGATNVGACKAKASASQCDQLIDRYATLVVTEKLADASAEQIQGDDAFKNCSSEVSQAEFACAMRAPNPDAFEKCLE